MKVMLSEKLKKLRKERGKTQQEMSETLNILRSTYGEYERGKILPPADKIQTLALYFGVSIDYLIGDAPRKSQDIKAELNRILEALTNQNSELTFGRETLDAESREILIKILEKLC